MDYVDDSYGRAGRFYNHLRQTLGFGQLTMQIDNRGAFLYSWYIGGKSPLVVRRAFTPVELIGARDIKLYAEVEGDFMREDYRKALHGDKLEECLDNG